MSGDVRFSSGDLVEYVRPVKGEPNYDKPIRVRGIVSGFSVGYSDAGDRKIRVWVYEGAERIDEDHELQTIIPEVTGHIQHGRIDKERELVIWDLDDLLSFDGFRVERRGNHPTDIINFTL